MTFRGLKLQHKLYLAFAGLIVLIVFTTGVIGVRGVKKDLWEQENLRNRAILKNLALNLKQPMFEEDFLGIDNLIESLLKIPGIHKVTVFNAEGRIVGSSDKRLLGTHDERWKRSAAAADAGGAVQISNLRNELYTSLSVPVVIGDERWGTAEVVFDNNELKARIQRNSKETQGRLAVLALVVLGVGFAGSYPIAYFLARPIKELREKMATIHGGNLDIPVDSPMLINCWEMMKCDMKECSVYGRPGARCWLAMGTKCDEIRGAYAGSPGDCTDCPVYKKSCGDEIGELRETFYEMLKKIKCGIKELEQANREKQELYCMAAIGEMSAKVAHEIRNALYSIGGAFSYIDRNVDSPTVKEFGSVIRDEIHRLKDLSDSFLNYAKPVKLRYSLQPVEKTIKDAVKLIEPEMEDMGVSVVLDLAGTGEAHYDVNQMKQVMLNLLLNAVDAMPGGGTIHIATALEEKGCRISIRDDGVGIEKENLCRIFDPFFTTKTKGTGLGLAVVNKIVRAHGGHIEVRSVYGKGAEVTVHMPFMPSDRAGEKGPRRIPAMNI